MNNKIIHIFILLCLTLCNLKAEAQDELNPVDDGLKKEIINSITSPYYAWNEISMSGKLNSPMLPVMATVKVYMQQDEELIISISAIWVGEAARIEIDRNGALIVNKLKNKYAYIPMSDMERACPGGLGAIQNLLLGRITLLGSGQLSISDSDNIEIYDSNPDLWLLVPDQELVEGAMYNYIYAVDRIDYLLQDFIVVAEQDNGMVTCSYTQEKRGMSISMDATMNGKGLQGVLTLNKPDASPKKISRIELGSKYQQTDLRGVLR